MSRARTRDRRVYLRSHPVLFALLAATRARPTVRLGRTVLVHDRDAYVSALTRVPLDRTAAATTGGMAKRLAGPDTLFDQTGDAHRHARRETAGHLGAAGVERLRPLWCDLLAARLRGLSQPAGELDLVPLAAEVAGVTAAALLDLTVDPLELADAARTAAAAAARAHLPGLHRGRAVRQAEQAAARLTALVGGVGRDDAARAAVLAVAAVNTTVAALPRAAAWAADDNLWSFAETHRQALADELLRVVAPTPLLPRVAAGHAFPAGCPVQPGDRLLLVARHAVQAHRREPDPVHPVPAQESSLVFGTGPHACPGARLARTQLVDVLAALAPYRPRVVRARADRRAALPSWAALVIRATR